MTNIKDKDLTEFETPEKDNFSEFDQMFNDAINDGAPQAEEEQQPQEDTQKEEQQPQENTQTEEEQPQEEQQSQEEQQPQEEEIPDELKSVIDELMTDAEKIWWDEVDKAASDVQDSLDNWEDKDEVLSKLAELENALNNANLEKETYKKEKDSLINKLNDLQEKLSDYEIKGYEYWVIENALDNDPKMKWFVKTLVFAKTNPDKVSKEKLINSLDNFIQDEFWISVKNLLNSKANTESNKMTMGDTKTPIEISIKDDWKDPLDKMLGI